MTSQRIQVVQPPDWVEAFKKQATREGKNLSEWLGECAVANLPISVARDLSKRPSLGRPIGDT